MDFALERWSLGVIFWSDILEWCYRKINDININEFDIIVTFEMFPWISGSSFYFTLTCTRSMQCDQKNEIIYSAVLAESVPNV